MFRIIISILLVISPCGASAQSLMSFKNRLAVADSTRAVVRVTEVGPAANAVTRLADPTEDKIKGYRVIIFFDNSQSARGKAVEAQRNFQELFGGVPTFMTYEIPYFKVAVGNCVTMEEAITLKGRVSGIFPGAFISKEDIPITDLAK